jgi:hypothetical protein
MRAFAVLLRRELSSRWLLLAASLAMGLLVTVFPLLVSRNGARPEEIRAASALAVALVWTLLLAVGLGATCLARDLGEHRLAFDFRLPAPATAIWSARLLGAYLTTLLAGIAVLAPSVLVGLDFQGAIQGLDLFVSRWIDSGDLPTLLSMGIVLPAVFVLALLLLAKNIGGLAIFGDRRWSALDLGSVILLALGIVLGFGELYHWGASGAGPSLARLAATVLLIGLIATTWLQVAKGRTEPDRAHRLASLALLATACCAGGSGLLRAQWIVHPDWQGADLRLADFSMLTDRIVLVSTHDPRTYPHRVPTLRYLLDLPTGRTLALGPWADRWGFWLAFSDSDERRLVWAEHPGAWSGTAPVTLFKLSLGQKGEFDGPAEEAPIHWSSSPVSWQLSPDGRHVASRWWDLRSGVTTVVLEELDTGKVLRSERLPACQQPGWLLYLDESSLLLECKPGFGSQRNWPQPVVRLDLTGPPPGLSEPLVLTGWIPRYRHGAISGGAGARAVLDPPQLLNADHPLDRSAIEPNGWTVHDLATGRYAAKLEIPAGVDPEDPPDSGVFFADHRFAAVSRVADGAVLAIWDPSGNLLRTLRFPASGSIRVFGPTDDQSSLFVIWAPPAARDEPARSNEGDLVDASTGSVRTLATGFRFWPMIAGSFRTAILMPDRSGEPLWFDPATASLRPIRGGEGMGGESAALGR